MTSQQGKQPSSQSRPRSDSSETIESVRIGFNTVLGINHAVRSLILDYALGAAILGLIPTPGNWGDVLGYGALGLLNLALLRDIRRLWGNPNGQDWLAIIGSIFGVFGALATAFMARLVVFTVGLFVPAVIVLNKAAGYAMLTWALGRVSNQFFFSARRVELSKLQQLLAMHPCDADPPLLDQ